MRQSTLILLITGASAIAAVFLAASWDYREDLASAIGGIAGFVFANGLVIAFRGTRENGGHTKGPETEALFQDHSQDAVVAYVAFSIGWFSFVGWLTGKVHQHGELAGVASGGLAGFILAVMVPAMHRSHYMSYGRRHQLGMSVIALAALLSIVWVMYEHLF